MPFHCAIILVFFVGIKFKNWHTVPGSGLKKFTPDARDTWGVSLNVSTASRCYPLSKHDRYNI